jgi:pimeloyl-ACP methyl ester carboxylesterase
MRLIFSSVIILCIFISCNDPIEEIISDYKQVEENIVAITGGTLVTSDSIKLTVPANALPYDGLVFLGRTGNEPKSVPNSNVEIEGNPITIRFPSEFILKPLKLQIPSPSSFIDTSKYFLLLFNGSTYFPMLYNVNGSLVNITIDDIAWESTENKNTHIASELIIFFARYKQTIPEKEMGLKKVIFNSETKEITYGTPAADASSKVLLLIHGWTASPAKWNDFIPMFISDNDLPYTEFWTFGYNSSWGINHNGELLSQLIEMYSNEARIDIVAHSMGGLVSRSMIENYDGAQYINKLITLGSPHEGSPLAVFRYAIGALVAEDNPDAGFAYNFTTQGFRDLDTASVFIREMKQLISPPLQYFTIAATNDPNQSLFSQISSNQLIEGPDDGIVAVSSAHGVRGATSSENDINIPAAWAHRKMLEDSAVYNQVIGFLL